MRSGVAGVSSTTPPPPPPRAKNTIHHKHHGTQPTTRIAGTSHLFVALQEANSAGVVDSHRRIARRKQRVDLCAGPCTNIDGVGAGVRLGRGIRVGHGIQYGMWHTIRTWHAICIWHTIGMWHTVGMANLLLIDMLPRPNCIASQSHAPSSPCHTPNRMPKQIEIRRGAKLLRRSQTAGGGHLHGGRAPGYCTRVVGAERSHFEGEEGHSGGRANIVDGTPLLWASAVPLAAGGTRLTEACDCHWPL